MGCGSSANRIDVVAADPKGSPSKSKIDRPRSKTVRVAPKTESDIHLNEEPKRGPRLLKRRGKQQGWGSHSSLGSSESADDSKRGTSATSKASHHSMDSGFADTECRNIVTENSDADKVREVEKSFNTPRNLGKPIILTKNLM